jgi:hypothetical protein
MTYRSTTGLGAVTPEQIGQLHDWIFKNGGMANPAISKPFMDAPCLPVDTVQTLAACYLGIVPPGVNELAFAKNCYDFKTYGVLDKLGCAADDTALVAVVPQCASEAEAAQLRAGFQYCYDHPNYDGTDKTLNAMCWTARRYPNAYAALLNLQLCVDTAAAAAQTAAAAQAAAQAAAAAQAQAQAEQERLQAQVDAAEHEQWLLQQAQAQADAARDEATPSELPYDYGAMYEGEVTELPPVPSTKAGTPWALIGVGGVVALGLGYVLLRKK